MSPATDLSSFSREPSHLCQYPPRSIVRTKLFPYKHWVIRIFGRPGIDPTACSVHLSVPLRWTHCLEDEATLLTSETTEASLRSHGSPSCVEQLPVGGSSWLKKAQDVEGSRCDGGMTTERPVDGTSAKEGDGVSSPQRPRLSKITGCHVWTPAGRLLTTPTIRFLLLSRHWIFCNNY